jgi:hypothetical protein
MACETYEALKDEWIKTMIAEDRAHMVQIWPEKKRVKQMQDTSYAVEQVVLRSKWHVQKCEQCKLEGNEVLERVPL